MVIAAKFAVGLALLLQTNLSDQLLKAIEKSDLKGVTAALRAGADPFPIEGKIRPLGLAVKVGQWPIVKALLDSNSKHRETAPAAVLHFAIEYRKPEIVRKVGAEYKVDPDGPLGNLYRAVMSRNVDLFEAVGAIGAKRTTERGLSILVAAAATTPRMLLAVMKAFDLQGKNPAIDFDALKYAANYSRDNILVLAGAGVNLADSDNIGRSVFFYMTRPNGRKERIETLAALGLNPIAPDAQGLSPIDYFEKEGDREMVRLLRKYDDRQESGDKPPKGALDAGCARR